MTVFLSDWARCARGAAVLATLAGSVTLNAQTVTAGKIEEIVRESVARSQLETLAQALHDSIGPRLTGSQELARSVDWVARSYRAWGIPARVEQYGTARGWDRGTAHIDLVSPRTRSLEGMLLTWSIGTERPVEAGVVTYPRITTAAEFDAWLPQVRGRFVALSLPEPTCRPDESWRAHAAPESFRRMQAERAEARRAWSASLRAGALRTRDLLLKLKEAGAAGALVALQWPRGWGVTKVGSATTDQLLELGLSCEDYGLVFRLAERNQGPVLRVSASARFTGEVPAANVIAELRGSERPDEYVVLSAHLDSWDVGSGATDNGAGTVTVMEAMRILQAVYPNSKRTIIAGHWSGEEQGLHGSRAFAEDRPDVLAGMQVLLNLDAGTGRVTSVSMGGFAAAAAAFRRWLEQVPQDVGGSVTIQDPGGPEFGSDHAAFACHGVPAFNLRGVSWDYLTYTWHTNRDTFDKLVFDELRSNAALLAMLAYLASEDPERVPREPRVMPANPVTGEMLRWPRCGAAVRSFDPVAR